LKFVNLEVKYQRLLFHSLICSGVLYSARHVLIWFPIWKRYRRARATRSSSLRDISGVSKAFNLLFALHDKIVSILIIVFPLIIIYYAHFILYIYMYLNIHIYLNIYIYIFNCYVRKIYKSIKRITSSNTGGSNSPITSTALGSLFAVKCMGPAACLFFLVFLLSFFSFLVFLSFFFSSGRSLTSSLFPSFFVTLSSSFLTADYNHKIYISMYTLFI